MAYGNCISYNWQGHISRGESAKKEIESGGPYTQLHNILQVHFSYVYFLFSHLLIQISFMSPFRFTGNLAISVQSED